MKDFENACPAGIDLEDALLGLLSDERSGALHRHLETCANCRQAYERTAALLRDLRAGPGSLQELMAPEPLVQRVVARLRDLDGVSDVLDPGSPVTRAAPTPTGSDDELSIRVRDDAPASRLGNYELLELIGQGGMGRVYKARHRRMGRVVALKILSEAQSRDADSIVRFQREVHAAARLIHPNIVTAFDADEADGRHFLVMEYIEGVDLAALVRREGPCTVEQAVRYTLDAARGLEFAHRHGIVHRDIKPSNLLLDKHGTVRILDMGLARLESHELSAAQAELTGTGMVMGTVDFMAPEQAVNTKAADARSDIYALGVTLWHLLRGCPMYEGDSFVEKLMAHQMEPIPSLSESRRDVRPGIDRIFQRMVAKKPADRYQNMGEVVAALEACRIPAGRRAAGQPTIPRRHRPTMALVVGGVAGLALLVALGAWAIVRHTGGTASVPTDVSASSAAGGADSPDPVRDASYPQPARWIDATAEMRDYALRKNVGTVEGDGVQVVPRQFSFPVADARSLRNAAVRVRFSRDVTFMLRCGGTPQKQYLVNVGPVATVIDIEDHGQVGIGQKPGLVKRVRGLANPTGFDIDAPHEFVAAAQGDRITAWLDGREVITMQDTTSGAGAFYVVSWSPDDPAFLRTVEYAELPEPAAAPSN